MALKPYTGAFTPLEAPKLKPYTGNYTPVTTGVHRAAPEPGLLEEGAAKLKSGLIAGRDWLSQSLGELIPDLRDEETRGQMDTVARGLGYRDNAEYQRALQAQRMAQQQRDFENADRTSAATKRGLQEISEAEGLWDATKAAVTNPRAVGMTAAQSLGMVAPSMAAGVVAGPAAPLAVGGASAAIEYQATMRDVLTEAGIDLTDAAQVRRALDDPELMAKAKDKAATRGVAIGTFDALTAGIAGRLLAASRGVGSAAARTGGELGVQLGGGMGGEAAAQALTGEYKPGDIVMEGIAEVPTAITEVPTNYGRAREAFRQRRSDEEFAQADYTDLAGRFGATITSRKRSAKRNQEVGGVANSQHLKGTAGDFVVPAEQKQAFMAEARARGYEAIDEGDHVHLELPKQRDAFNQRKDTGIAGGSAHQRVNDMLAQARERRGVTRRDTPQAEDSDKPTTRKIELPERRPFEELIARANDPTLPPAERRAAKKAAQAATPERRIASTVDQLRDQLLDQVTEQARTLEQPVQQPTPFEPAPGAFAQPADTAIPAAQVPPATEPFTPEVTSPAQIEAPTAVPAAPLAPQPAPAPQPVPQAPEKQASPVAPPARDLEPYGPWRPVAADQTPETGLLHRVLADDPVLGPALQIGPQDAGKVYHVRLEPAQQKRLDQLGAVLGRKIVLFGLDSPRSTGFGGAAFDDRHIFVNYAGLKAQGKPLLGVIGHEFTHTLRNQGSKLLEDLLAHMRKQVNANSSYVQQRYAQYRQLYDARQMGEAAQRDAFTEELAADFIGDLLNDEQFWAELAQEDIGLFKRTINALIRFIGQMAQKARRMGADDAFRDLTGMREQALAILREHIRDPDNAKGVNQRGGIKIKAAADGLDISRADLVRERAIQIAHRQFEQGNYMDAQATAGRASPEYAPPMPIDSEEKKRFFKGSSPKVNRDDLAGVYFHGTARDILRFQPATGDAVFLAERSSFSGPYAAAKMAENRRLGEFDVIVDGKSMTEQKGEHKKGSVDYAVAELLLQAQGDPEAALNEFLPDYAFYNPAIEDIDYLDTESQQQVEDVLNGLIFITDDNPGFITKAKREKQAGMQIIPLVTNVRNPWAFDEAKDVDALIAAMKAKFGTVEKLRDALKQKQSYKDWDHVARQLSRGSWPLIEDKGADIPGLIRGMGHDAYFVSEEGHTNLAVFDPNQIKSAYGNVGTWGVREPTAEEAASLGMTLEEALVAQNAGDIRLDLAYHGSNQAFDQFDLGKVGTGDGNQNFGYGLYFSSSKDIAAEYGKVRKAMLPEADELLHWEGTVEEQPAKVREAIAQLGVGGKRGRDVYRALSKQLGSDKAASERLAQLGVPGARYTQPSSDYNEQNFVIWDVQRIEEAVGDLHASLGSAFHQSFTNGLWNDTTKEKLDRAFIDEFRDLREIQKAIANSQFGGGPLPTSMDARLAENLRHGAFKDQRDRAEERFIRPIAQLISRNKLTLEQFSDYLHWRHAPERIAYLRSKMDPALAAQTMDEELGGGISAQQAQANIAALDPRTRQVFERAAKFIDAMRKYTLDTMLNSGQITQSHYDNLLKQYRYYVPLRGDGMDRSDRLMNGPRGMNMRANPVGQRATGRARKPENIIEQMLGDMERSLVDAQKQLVLDKLVRLIAANPDPDLWEVSPITAERKWVGGVLTVVQANGVPKDQITFMHRGIPVKIEIRHEGLRKALLQMSEPMPQWLRRVGRVTRWLSAVKTSFSPFFLLINPVRDAGFATLGVISEHGMSAMRDVAKFYPYTYGAIRRDDANRPVAPGNDPVARKMQQYVREFSAAGGKTGYTYVNDIREQQKKLSSMMARHAKSPGMQEVLAGGVLGKDGRLLINKAWQHTAHLFEVVNDMAENSTRLAVYAAMREKGMSVEQAASYAKEVTVNFNRRGSLGKVLGGFYMFFNAAMQGGVRMAKLMKNRKFQMMVGGMVLSSYSLALGQMLAAGDDDDGESNYDKAIPDSQAQRSVGIYLGGGKSLALPVPYGPNIATYLGYRMARFHYDMIRGRDPSVGKASGDILTQAMMSMSPLDPGRGWGAFLPEFARVPYQAVNNRNDFGGKLNYRIGYGGDAEMLPAYHQTDPKTGLFYRWFGAGMNALSGGGKYDKGAVDLSGEQWRYVAESFGGGMLRLGTETYELIENTLAGVDPEPSDVPLANVYFRGKGERRHSPAYYENKREFDEVRAKWKAAVADGDEAAIDAILKHAPWIEGAEVSASTVEGKEMQAGTVAEADREVQRQISALRKEQRAILNDKTLDWRERKRLAREIDLEIAQLHKDFNYAINQARGVRSTQQSR